MKLTQEQTNEISKHNWNIVQQGAYLDLYEDDFVADIEIWGQICDQLKIPRESKSATILYIGVKN